MEPAPVTVIVPTFNRANYLPQALDSILAQSRPPRQIIVVNDGSQDHTKAVLATYGDRVQVLNQPNGGKSSALNAALPLATGEFIWIFDDDDIALPDALENHLNVIERHPAVGYSYSSFVWATNGPDDRIVPGPEYRMPDVPTNEVYLRLLEGVFFRLTGCLVRARCYAEVGLFDPAMIRSEDYDMQLRLARRFSCVYIGVPTMYARQHDGPRGGARDLHSAAERNRKHLAYDRLVTERALRHLSLADFLPYPSELRTLTLLQRRHALLQRQNILMRKGFWDEALRDLRSAMDADTSGTPLSEAERRICLSMLGEPIVFENVPATRALFRDIRQICGSRLGREARVQMARGVLHSLFSRAWSPAESLQILAGLCSLVGVRGVLPLALREWRWREPAPSIQKVNRYLGSQATGR